MGDSLATYLNDHLAGSHFAIEMLEFLRDRHPGKALGGIAEEMLAEVEEDRNTLQKISERAGAGVPVMKEAAAWVSEKVSRFKLGQGDFGTFLALEALALGILGKRALWQALAVIADADDRLQGVDYARLIRRAESQYSRAEQLRRQAARAGLAPEPTSRKSVEPGHRT
ncbi:MAG: hypothetical protein JOZ32_13795 [Bryobacterales bacterium]|nr:hypothetical protein [Bryobacterales bacterium]